VCLRSDNGETGLNYNYFRDYDQSVGRYVQSDPIGLVGGFNLFQYAYASPNVNIDPMGLFVPIFCIPWPSSTSEWINVGDPQWNSPGSEAATSVSAGATGTCFWQRWGLQQRQRDATEREFCWGCTRTCAGNDCEFRIVVGETHQEREIDTVSDIGVTELLVLGSQGYRMERCVSPWNSHVVAERIVRGSIPGDVFR